MANIPKVKRRASRGQLQDVVRARRAWAVIDAAGNIMLRSIRSTRQDAMSQVLSAYLCAEEPATIRKWAEAELREANWRCAQINLVP